MPLRMNDRPFPEALLLRECSESKARGLTMDASERDALKDSDFRTVLRPLFLSEIDTTEAIEVILGEGDACVVSFEAPIFCGVDGCASGLKYLTPLVVTFFGRADWSVFLSILATFRHFAWSFFN